MIALLAEAATQPAPPQSWTEPAALPFVLTSLLTFIGGLAVIVVWVRGKLEKVETKVEANSARTDRLSERTTRAEDRTAMALLHTPPPAKPATVGGVPAPTTLPRHSTETNP